MKVKIPLLILLVGFSLTAIFAFCLKGEKKKSQSINKSKEIWDSIHYHTNKKEYYFNLTNPKYKNEKYREIDCLDSSKFNYLKQKLNIKTNNIHPTIINRIRGNIDTITFDRAFQNLFVYDKIENHKIVKLVNASSVVEGKIIDYNFLKDSINNNLFRSIICIKVSKVLHSYNNLIRKGDSVLIMYKSGYGITKNKLWLFDSFSNDINLTFKDFNKPKVFLLNDEYNYWIDKYRKDSKMTYNDKYLANVYTTNIYDEDLFQLYETKLIISFFKQINKPK